MNVKYLKAEHSLIPERVLEKPYSASGTYLCRNAKTMACMHATEWAGENVCFSWMLYLENLILLSLIKKLFCEK